MPSGSGPAPVTVITGDEDLLVERAVSAAVAAAGGSRSAAAPDTGAEGTDVHDVAAAGLAPGEITALTAPSLFGTGCVVIVRGVQDAGKELAAEITRLAGAPPSDAALVFTHAGGAKGKALLAA